MIVKIMPKNIIFLIVFSVILLTPCIAKGAVVINEIMYDLEEGSDSGREWIEIFNSSDTTIDLAGWKFNDGSNHGLNEPPKNGGQGLLEISADEYLILTGNATSFLTEHPGFSSTVIDTVMSLKNTSATLKILDSEGNEIDSVTYENTWGANGDGNSLQRKGSSTWGVGNPTPGVINVISSEEAEEELEEESETPSVPSSASPSNRSPIADAGNNIIAFIDEEVTFDGSKSSDPDSNELAYEWNLGEGGVKNDIIVTHKYSFPGTYLVTLMVYDGRNYSTDTIVVEIYPKKITINEFLPSPVGKDEDGEWIEIYNDSDFIIDISGWQLDDEDGGSKPFIFPENTLIAPKNYLVFSRKTTGIALNNDTDKVRLLLSTGIVFQEINYEKAKEGQASIRTGEGFVWGMPTPGSPNILIGIAGQISDSKEPLQSETTNQPSQNMSLQYESPPEIKGGWAQLPQSNTTNTNTDQQQYYQLANLEESTQDSSGIGLIILIIAAAAIAVGIGVINIKQKKKI